MDNKVTTLVEKCSACGKDHEITFKRLATPISTPEATYGYMGHCEEADRLVLIRYDEEKKVETYSG